MLIVAASIIVVGLLFAGITTWTGRTASGGFVCIAGAAMFAGVLVANLPRITGIAVQAGATSSIDVKLQEVENNVTEARQIRGQIETLAKRVEQGEQNVTAMRDNVRQAYQSLFESFAYIVGTRNLMPPPNSINQEITRHINILAAFAYPDPQERSEAIGKVMEKTHAAQVEMGAIRPTPNSPPPAQ